MAAELYTVPATQHSDTVYASLQQLLRCRLLAKDLNLSKQRKLLSSQTGLQTSRFRGRGIDFAEVRNYQPGDDIRSIDWRVTARTGKAHTKVYTEERERPVVLLTDQSQAMFFGSRVMFKSVVAAQVTALLGWAALARGDRVGGLIFSRQQQTELRPKRSPHRVLQLLEQLLEYNHGLNKHEPDTQRFNLADVLEHCRHSARPGSEIFLITDFHDFDADCKQQLFHISRHNDLVCLCISDPLEAQLPPPGTYAVTDGRNRLTLSVNDKLRGAYQESYRRHMEELKQSMEELRIPFIRVRTDSEPLRALQMGLGLTTNRR